MRKGLFCNENFFSFRAYKYAKGTKGKEGRKASETKGRCAVPSLSPSLPFPPSPCGLGFPFPSGLRPSLPFRFGFVPCLRSFCFSFLFLFPFSVQ
jgi:hypothetical protein